MHHFLLHGRQFSVCFRSYYIGINALDDFNAERGRKKLDEIQNCKANSTHNVKRQKLRA